MGNIASEAQVVNGFQASRASIVPKEITKSTSSITEMPRHVFEFTEKFHKPTWKKYADDAAVNGLREPIRFTEIGGTNYIVQGNNKLGWAYKFKWDTVPAEQVCLPFRGFLTEAHVIDSAIPRQQMLNSPIIKFWESKK